MIANILRIRQQLLVLILNATGLVVPLKSLTGTNLAQPPALLLFNNPQCGMYLYAFILAVQLITSIGTELVTTIAHPHSLNLSSKLKISAQQHVLLLNMFILMDLVKLLAQLP